MKNIVLVLFVTLIGLTAQAQEKKNKNAKVEFEVNGNCEMCKKRIEKAAYSVPGVKMAVWSIETHALNLIINEEKASVIEVKEALAKVGHDTDEVKATKEVYGNLHMCCQYERK